jgi:hypothetical protein
MIELIAIFLQFFIFLIICSFPFNPNTLNGMFNSKVRSFNYIDCHAINIIILINILLITSFFKVHLTNIFLALLSVSIIFLIKRRKEYLLMVNEKNLIKFILFFIITISIFISTASAARLEWDGFHWIQKALVFFNNTDIQNLRYTNMPMYPHLGGYIWAFFWKNSLLEYEYFGRLFYVYFYIISIFTIFSIAKFKSQRLIFLLILSLVFITYEPYLFAGYQEYLIFSTLLIVSRFITTINFNKNIEYNKIFLILLIMSSMIWFKDEGIFYFLIFGSLLVLLQKSPFKGKIVPLLIIFLTIYTQYYLQKNVIGIYDFNAEFFGQEFINQISDFKFIFLKVMAITKHTIIAFIKYPLWIIILFSLLFVKIFSNKESSFLKYCFYAFILNILFIYAVYLNDPLDYEFVLSVTIDRVLFQTSGFYLSIFILILNKNKKIAANL